MRAFTYTCEDYTTGEEWLGQNFQQVCKLWESAESEDLLAVAYLSVGEVYSSHEFYVKRTM
jgi:hypothetical protein